MLNPKRFWFGCKTTVIVTAATLAAISPRIALADVISPSAETSVEGNYNNGFPFNLGFFGIASMRYEQVYAASEFGSSPVIITAIKFRPEGSNGAGGGAFSSTLSS